MISFLFAAIYKLLPEVHLRWDDVVIGASVTSPLFTIGKQLIGPYLGKAAFGSTYGAAGSLVIVLVWVYYSAMQFAWVLNSRKSTRKPSELNYPINFNPFLRLPKTSPSTLQHGCRPRLAITVPRSIFKPRLGSD